VRGSARSVRVVLLVVAVLAAMVGCSKDNPTWPSHDGIAPSAVADLSVESPTSTSLALTWTATGDDGATGTASQYDIRYSTRMIGAANWDSAEVVQVVGEPVPKVAGSREIFVVTGLSAGMTYYFAMKVGNERSNWSGISNVACGTIVASSGWFALGPGVDGFVNALTEYNGQLIAGGYFTTAGCINANGIAAWNGSSWSALGTGTSDHVVALTEYNGQLIAGGYFFAIGGVAARFVAAWDGSSWSALAGLTDEVSALTVYNGALISARWIPVPGGNSSGFGRIAAWDGNSWSGVGVRMNGAVYSLTVYNGHLIAGGGFTTADDVAADRIASYGGSWSALGTGLRGGSVYALTVYNGQLIAGGEFSIAGGVAANHIAAWDGSSWSALGTGLNGRVRELTVYNGHLIAGGDFTAAGRIAANRIAEWDGSSWSPLRSGMDGPVRALTVYNGQLIAGGEFTSAGGASANHIAGCSY